MVSTLIVDPQRHLEVFNPSQFGKRRIDVIGVGATGSKVVAALARLGIQNIHVWDYDLVEAHNVANQEYGLDDIGKLKVEALRDRILRDTGISISIHPVKISTEEDAELNTVSPDEVSGDIIFLLVDSMSARRDIFDELENNMTTDLLIETRMGPSVGRVYAFNPNCASHVEAWRKTLYSDEEAGRSACGASTSVGPTASIIASYAVWRLIKWFELGGASESASRMDNELNISVGDGNILKARWAALG